MKQYPSIDYWKDGRFGEKCYGFDKLDGSNMRFEWSKKRGWYKFGSRTQMITPKTPILGSSIKIFMDKYAQELEYIFLTNRQVLKGSSNFVAFCEYLGPTSFAGFHDMKEIQSGKMDVVLFDVSMHKHGLLNPEQFIELFGHLHIPEILYEGIYDEALIKSVRDGSIPTKEGLVVKGLTRKSTPWMVKLKNDEWLKRVKAKGQPEEILY